MKTENIKGRDRAGLIAKEETYNKDTFDTQILQTQRTNPNIVWACKTYISIPERIQDYINMIMSTQM